MAYLVSFPGFKGYIAVSVIMSPTYQIVLLVLILVFTTLVIISTLMMIID